MYQSAKLGCAAREPKAAAPGPRPAVVRLGALAGNRAVARALQRDCGIPGLQVPMPRLDTVIDKLAPLLAANIKKLAGEAYKTGHKRLAGGPAQQAAHANLLSEDGQVVASATTTANKHAEAVLIDSKAKGAVVDVSQPCCVVCAALCHVFGLQIPEKAPKSAKVYNYALPDALFSDLGRLDVFLGRSAVKVWRHVAPGDLTDEHKTALRQLFSGQQIYVHLKK